MHTISDKKMLLLRPEEIFPSGDRQRKALNDYELRSLAKSISAVGIIEPLSVRRDGKDRYVLISGERRYQAAKLAGLRRLPCFVHNTDEKESAVLMLADKLQRTNLNFFEEALSIDRIAAVYGTPLSELSAKIGLTEAETKAKLDLLKIEPLERERILSAGLTEQHAQELIRLNKKDIPLVLDTVIEKDLSAKQTRQFISAILSPMSETRPPARRAAIGNAKFFTNSLSKLLLSLQNAGVQASSVKRETDDYIEYEIRIEKNTTHQLAFSGI